MENTQVFEFKLKDGNEFDGTIYDLLQKGYKEEDIVDQKLLYDEVEEKLSTMDINQLLNH